MLALVIVAACGDGGSALPLKRPPEDPTFATSDATTGVAATTGDGTTTTGDGTSTTMGTSGGMPGGTCEAHGDCLRDGEVCRAELLPGPTPQPGPFECGACVGLEVPSLWCLDDASCCDAEAVCTTGLCRVPVATSTSDTGSTTAGEAGSSSSGSSG